MISIFLPFINRVVINVVLIRVSVASTFDVILLFVSHSKSIHCHGIIGKFSDL